MTEHFEKRINSQSQMEVIRKYIVASCNVAIASHKDHLERYYTALIISV